MSFDINKEIEKIIAREGGYVDHPADRGGPTNMGITLKTLTMYLARQCTEEDVKNLSKQTARDIYYTNYYIKPDIKSLPDLIKPVMLDMVVNSGKRGIKILQDLLTCYNYQPGKIDGLIGPKTIQAAQFAAADMGNEFVRKLTRRRVIFYENLVKADESQRVFLAGWIARAESFLPDKTA